MSKEKNKAKKLPRGYLSWSQIQLWKKDPNLYYQVYIEGLDQFRTKYLELGKRLATTLENGFDEGGDPMFEMMCVFMPGYPKREFKIDAVLEGIPLKGVLDGFDDDELDIGEYKSGKRWTQSMVDKSGQLTMYALLVWIKYKRLPKRIRLHWARTEEDLEGNLKLTGDIRTFKTSRTMRDIIVFSKEIRSAYEGIAEMYQFYSC